MRYLVVASILTCALPARLLAGGDFFCAWEPFSRIDRLFGDITISATRISYATGPSAGLEPVRDGASVFRLVEPQGHVFEDCGNRLANFIGFHVLDRGGLAVIHYLTDRPPPEPTGRNALEVVEALAAVPTGTCSVAFFTPRPGSCR